MSAARSTSDRLLVAGMELFAERGFRATTVGDIEAAVGLAPRRGALYKHFASKQALLEAAVRSHIDAAAAGASGIRSIAGSFAPVDELETLRPLIGDLGRWFLGEMDRLEDLTRVLEHEGGRLEELVGAVKEAIVDLSYRTAAAVVATIRPTAIDPEATAILILGPLVALRRTAWTFGSAPLGVEDERMLAAWTDLTLHALEAP